MIQATNTPTFTQESPAGVFDYNVLAVTNNITYTFRSLQARLYSIDRVEGDFAQVILRENITDYLLSVVAVIGSDPIIYIDDNQGGISAYTGPYRATIIQTVNLPMIGDVTQFVVKNIGDNSPTYAGSKTYPEDYASQVAYKYRNAFTFEVRDITRIGSANRDRLLTTVRQQSGADGSVVFNISEIARGYTPETGALTLQVRVSEKDYFGNSSALVADPAHFVEGRLSSQNYGAWTLFNPDTGGSILPSTGGRLLYSPSAVYPFWVNFTTNDLVARASKTTIVVRSYQGSLAGMVRVDIPVVIGLNSIDLSQFDAVVDLVLQTQPDRLGISVEMTTTSQGQFGLQFGTQFYRISDVITTAQESSEYAIEAEPYTLDNRRDFYFAFDNGHGGQSTFLCRQFNKVTDPEIVALRNRDTISNSVARETESVELAFKQENLSALRFLLGYDMEKLIKEGGIFESKNVTRIGALGDTKQWIVKQSSYATSNSDVYKDLAITLYRPLSSGFETPVPTRLKVLGVDFSETQALVFSSIVQFGGVVLERGALVGNTYFPSVSESEAFSVKIENLTPGTLYEVRAYARTNYGIYYSGAYQFTTTQFTTTQ